MVWANLTRILVKHIAHPSLLHSSDIHSGIMKSINDLILYRSIIQMEVDAQKDKLIPGGSPKTQPLASVQVKYQLCKLGAKNMSP